MGVGQAAAAAPATEHDMATAPTPPRVRMRVVQVTSPETGSNTYLLTAVTAESAENTAFFKAGANAQLNLGAVAPAIDAMFTPGSEFFVDFTPAN